MIEGPIALTNTHSVGTVRDAIIAWRVKAEPPDASGYWWSLPVVAETYDGELVHLPNKKVLDNPLVNNSANGARRTELEVRTGRADLDHLVAIVNDVLTGNVDIADDPPAAVHITSIGRDEIILLVRVWHRPGLTRSVSSALCRSLYGALTEASIDGTVVTPPPTAHP